jgi:hypothetical protein
MKRISRRKFVATTASAAGAGVLSPLADQIEAPRPAASLLLRPFGTTGVRVTMIGLGGGSRFYEPIPDDELGAELVRKAIDSGIGVIETAANYGPQDTSERRIGMAMKTHRGRVFLETKVDARDYEGAMREMERSLKLLQTDKLDLVLHHNLGKPEEVSQVLSDHGAPNHNCLFEPAGQRRFGPRCGNRQEDSEMAEKEGIEIVQMPEDPTFARSDKLKNT